MLQIRPSCENCDAPLPNTSDQAMICSFECTFCKDCVDHIFHNVCPNCGGGFEKRPTRPSNCFTRNCVDRYPASQKKVFKPVVFDKFKEILNIFRDIEPRKR